MTPNGHDCTRRCNAKTCICPVCDCSECQARTAKARKVSTGYVPRAYKLAKAQRQLEFATEDRKDIGIEL